MKKILFLIFWMSGKLLLPAQQHNSFDYFKKKEQNLWLFKWNLNVLPPAQHFFTKQDTPLAYRPNNFPLSFSLEGKVWKNLAVQGTLSAHRFLKERYTPSLVVQSAVEFRWFLPIFSFTEEVWRNPPDNLHGFYTSFEWGQQYYRYVGWMSFFPQAPVSFVQNFALRIGFQTRWLQHGFFDANLGLVSSHSNGWEFDGQPVRFMDSQSHRMWLEPRVRFGGAVGDFERGKTSAAERQHFYKKNEPRRQLFKLNLFRLLQFYEKNTFGNLSFDWERRLGNSPFSIDGRLEGDFIRRKFGDFNFKKIRWSGGLAHRWEVRWYFSQLFKSELHRNYNLNGFFWGANLGWKKDWRMTYYWFENNTMDSKQWNVLLGAQSRILQRGFVEYRLGAGRTTQRVFVNESFLTENRFWHLFSELRVGWVL